jgi:hypothetical protein
MPEPENPFAEQLAALDNADRDLAVLEAKQQRLIQIRGEAVQAVRESQEFLERSRTPDQRREERAPKTANLKIIKF